MGIDFGEARIGVAFSDLLCMIATGKLTIIRISDEQAIETLAKLAQENSVDEVVFGLPLQMDGVEGERAVRVREFAEKLKSYANVKVAFVDERLTSVEAEELLKERKVPWQKRKQMLDMISAEIILQTYLNSH